MMTKLATFHVQVIEFTGVARLENQMEILTNWTQGTAAGRQCLLTSRHATLAVATQTNLMHLAGLYSRQGHTDHTARGGGGGP